jgi:hypothetical protein
MQDITSKYFKSTNNHTNPLSFLAKPSMSWAFIGIFVVVFSLSFCPKIWNARTTKQIIEG